MGKSIFELSRDLKAKKAKAIAKRRAEKLEAKNDKEEKEPEVEDTEQDVSSYHIGGGYYEIGDEKVRGKNNALKLLSSKQ